MTLDDHELSADPQIQKDYEAALGAFLVAFNRLEYYTSTLIVLAFDDAGLSDVGRLLSRDSFQKRLDYIKLISRPGRSMPDQELVKELKALAEARNGFAHGHFDQNPFDGDFDIIGPKGETRIPPSQMIALQQRCDIAFDSLRACELSYDFDDIEDDE